MARSITVKLDANNHFTVNMWGATLTSLVIGGVEHIYVSSKAIYDDKKAIRGGIPICFPQFGPWEKGPQHGFARIMEWKKEEETNGKLVLSICDNTFTKGFGWDHSFKLIFTVTLTKGSDGKVDFGSYLSCSNNNTNDQTFDFTALLHTYFRTDDISLVEITGFKGVSYIDKLKASKSFVEDREVVKVTESADSVYYSTSPEHIVNLGNGRKISLMKFNLPDSVFWNPWKEGNEKIGDLDTDGYLHFVCVEAGSVKDRVLLKPGDTWTAGQNFIV